MSSAYHVLVVDDEPVLREICQEALSDAGYEVGVAADGREALGKLGRHGYDLVISDLRMPDMNGRDLLEQIRQRSLDVDFLVMTGFGTTETAVDIMKNGAADYIAKPFDIRDMLLRVRSILDQRAVRQEQKKLSAVVRMMNLSKRLGAQLNHVAVVEEFLLHLRENFSPDAICLVLPELLEKGPRLVQGRILQQHETLHAVVVRLCDRIMAQGRSYLVDQYSLRQSAFNMALFPQGFPYSIMAVPLELPQRRIGVIALVREEAGALYNEQDLQLFGVFASHAASALQNAHLYSRLRTMNQEVIRSFAQAVEVKDLYTRGHSERVADYACHLGLSLGLSSRELDRLHMSGMLHDIGKIGIPDHILNKPGALSDDEYETMKRHSVMGREILGQVGSMKDVTDVIYHHHERMDGLGYPEGLHGEDIPFLARIICIADSYEAMTSNRAYRQALPLDKVMYTLDRGAGTQWDRTLTLAWLKIVEQHTPGYPSL